MSCSAAPAAFAIGAISGLVSATASFSAVVVGLRSVDPVTGCSPASTALRALVRGVVSAPGTVAAAAGPEGTEDSGVVPGAGIGRLVLGKDDGGGGGLGLR